MYISKILSQFRRDFTALYKCEHCGHEREMSGGYDDDNYHENVVPILVCEKCGKSADLSTFKPRKPKYPKSMEV